MKNLAEEEFAVSKTYTITLGQTDFRIAVDDEGTCYEAPQTYYWMVGMVFYDISDWVDSHGGRIREYFSHEDAHSVEYWFFD